MTARPRQINATAPARIAAALRAFVGSMMAARLPAKGRTIIRISDVSSVIYCCPKSSETTIAWLRPLWFSDDIGQGIDWWVSQNTHRAAR
jgi:hypothetical protein